MSAGAAIARWEHRYGLVLALILCSLTFQLAAPDEDWARLVTIALQGGTLVLALYASEARPAIERLATAVVVVAVLASAAALIGFGQLGATGGRIVAVLLVALAPLAILKGVVAGVRRHGAVTLHTMFGVLCIYLLIGMLFSYAYGLVGDAQSEPFFASGVSPDISDYLYFSFATITTVGYGDLAAATDLGRSVAIAEALIGQIYLVTVVAVIVGSLSQRRPSS
jgi:ion channel